MIVWFRLSVVTRNGTVNVCSDWLYQSVIANFTCFDLCVCIWLCEFCLAFIFLMLFCASFVVLYFIFIYCNAYSRCNFLCIFRCFLCSFVFSRSSIINSYSLVMNPLIGLFVLALMSHVIPTFSVSSLAQQLINFTCQKVQNVSSSMLPEWLVSVCCFS